MTVKRIAVQRALRGKYLSALSSSGSKHLSAVCSSHSFTETVFSAPLPFFRLECHFHWYRTSFFSSNVLPLFYEHCHYYSKKGASRQEKNDSKLPQIRLFYASGVRQKKLFSTENKYLDFLRFFFLYLVEKANLLPFCRISANFSAQFSVAPVDNFCYTVREDQENVIP